MSGTMFIHPEKNIGSTMEIQGSFRGGRAVVCNYHHRGVFESQMSRRKANIGISSEVDPI